ncbi:MAG: histidine phosphatase family protein, partial [Chloroflexi bacterium]|nr:histidine phosphatase family protein [Chloroflexota bacterium]
MNMNLFESSPKDVTRLILVRHGRTSANQAGRIGAIKDYPLDETGKEQAARVARRLKRDFPIAVIYASPILRTKQTAQAVADEFGLGDIQFRDELKEYYFGMAADHTMEEIK